MLRIPAIATVCVIAAIVAYWLSGVVAAGSKLAALEPLPPRAHYAVTLAFPPERFHQLRLQDKGRVVEVRGRTVYMMDVTPSALTDIARAYWVDGVAPWAGR